MKRKHLLAMMVAGAIALVGCGGGDDENGGGGDNGGSETTAASGEASADKGEQLFAGTCASCHGQDAKGLEGLGKDLTASEWVAEQTDDQLIEMINTGRPASHELNTTGVDMPPKGGNPALTDEQILDIIAYIQTLK